MAVRFAHSLVPIAFAYVVAHYFSFLVIEGQIGLSRLSDPFGRDWNLFGTRDWLVNLTLVSPTTIWYVQVFAIVAGHIGGVILARPRHRPLRAEGRAPNAVRAPRGDGRLHRVRLLILSG